MIEIYEKRGSWYVKEEGKDIKQFGSEEAAKASLGWLDTCECEDCDCDPCECEED
jgi:hypothetical protein|tara:strand:- start:267 stop:431 length:165 start_codon:yes stop_codon:yes gene_type:complete